MDPCMTPVDCTMYQSKLTEHVRVVKWRQRTEVREHLQFVFSGNSREALTFLCLLRRSFVDTSYKQQTADH